MGAHRLHLQDCKERGQHALHGCIFMLAVVRLGERATKEIYSSDFAMQFALAARGWHIEPWEETAQMEPRFQKVGFSTSLGSLWASLKVLCPWPMFHNVPHVHSPLATATRLLGNSGVQTPGKFKFRSPPLFLLRY